MPTGRPQEYNPDIIYKAQQYLLSCVDTTETGLKLGELKLKVKLPSIEGLALFLGIHKDTVYDWEGKYPEFSDVIERLRHQQAEKLMDNGLSGNYNPTIAKLLLAKHGYRDSQELVGANGKDLIPDPETKKLADAAVAAYLPVISKVENKDGDTGNPEQQPAKID